MLSLANSRPAFYKVICNFSYTVLLTHYLLISGLASAGTFFQHTVPPNLLNNVPSNMDRASVVKNDISNYSNCMFPRLTLHACALTHTILLSYRGISLSFHLVTVLIQLVMHYSTFSVQFQLNSDFSHTFLNGQFMYY